MTDPRFAYDTDKGRYYAIPGVEAPLISVTNAISAGLAKHALPRWYANMAAEAAWELAGEMVLSLRRPLCGTKDYQDRCGVCRDCVDSRIKEAAEDKRDSAANLGTRVHKLAEAHVTGEVVAEDPDLDREAGLYVAQYLRFLKDFGVDPQRDIVSAEATVYDERLGYAGTGDLWVRLPFEGFLFGKDGMLETPLLKAEGDGRGLFLLDIKTSRRRAVTQSFPENDLQLAALRHASTMLLPDDTVQRNLPVRGAGTLQLRENRYALIPLPAGTASFRAFREVLALAKWAHDTWPGNFDHRPITPTGRRSPKRGEKE